jgi:hypothetical protein
VTDGFLHLIDYNNESVGIAQANAIGSLVLSLPQPSLPPSRFRATFKLRMGRGSGADGTSFSFGDIPVGPIGELGAGQGLRVCFRTFYFERVEVWYGNKLLHVSNASAEVGTLRSNDFAEVLVQYDQSGLTVRHMDVLHADMLQIEAWEPQPGWQFALGARGGGESDDHHIDDLAIDAGSSYAPATAAVALTLNGLQFTEGADSQLLFEYQVESAVQAGVTEQPSDSS